MDIQFPEKLEDFLFLEDADAKYPIQSTKRASAYDCYAHSIEEKPDGRIVIGLGFHTIIPDGWRGIIEPRSSLSKMDLIMGNHRGIIDTDYRGEWKITFKRFPSTPALMKSFLLGAFDGFKTYNVGDRCAQIYFEPVYQVPGVKIINKERGEGRYGSTGA
jgi:dUTPase